MEDASDTLPAAISMLPVDVIPPGAVRLREAPKLLPPFSPPKEMLPATFAVKIGEPLITVREPRLSVLPDAVLPLIVPVE